jgi:hypothetical protein
MTADNTDENTNTNTENTDTDEISESSGDQDTRSRRQKKPPQHPPLSVWLGSSPSVVNRRRDILNGIVYRLRKQGIPVRSIGGLLTHIADGALLVIRNPDYYVD